MRQNCMTLGALIIFLVISSCVSAEKFVSFDTLCFTTEKIYFSCEIDGKSDKILSVCGTRTPWDKSGYLVYRFGSKEKVELEYPKDRKNTDKIFTHESSHSEEHIRQYSRESIRFDIGAYRYRIFESIADAELDAQGVEVINTNTSTTQTLECKQPAIGTFRTLTQLID